MTILNSTADLAIAEITFFGLALVLTLLVVVRHGFSRKTGWILLSILCLLRLIGGSATLFIQTHPMPPSKDLLELATITSAIGTAPLLMALAGVLGILHNGMKSAAKNVGDLQFRIIHVVSVVALVLAIIGGIFHLNDNTAKQSTGESLTKTASVMFLAVFAALAAISILTALRKVYVWTSERKLLIACLAVLPFLLVRVIYAVLVAFCTSPSSIFYFANVDIYVSAFMQFLTEAMVILIFTSAGLLVPKTPGLGTANKAENA